MGCPVHTPTRNHSAITDKNLDLSEKKDRFVSWFRLNPLGSSMKQHITNIIFTALIVAFSSCGANLHEATLHIALLNEPYTYQLSAEDESWSFYDDQIFFVMTRGTLPAGVVVSGNGAITGTPAQLGNYEFRVSAYAIEYSYYDWDWFHSHEDVSRDSEWYTLFVTENSTNPACPAMNDIATTETFICVGEPQVEQLASGDDFTLDINYFIENARAGAYDIWSIGFSINYDGDLFDIDPNNVTSANLREAATRSDATVSYTFFKGRVDVLITARSKSLHRSGRILDLPVQALQNIPAGDYDFTVTITTMASDNPGDAIPTSFEVDGLVTVEQEATEETDEDAEEDEDEEGDEAEAQETELPLEEDLEILDPYDPYA